jgi:hypothetical protein
MPQAGRVVTRFQDADDVNIIPGAGIDDYSVTYDHATGEFVATNVSTSPGGSDTHVQFNDGGAFGGDADFTYNKTTNFVTVAGGVIAPIIKPASDSTTAIQLQDSGGTSVLNVDTTNARLGIGTTSPSKSLHARLDQAGQTDILVENQSVSTNASSRVTMQSGSSGGTFGAFSSGYTAISELADKVAYHSFTGALQPTAIAFMARGGSEDIEFYTGGESASNKRMVIKNSGNIGIATDSPSERLHVIDEDAATNAVTNITALGHNSTGTPAAGFGGGLLYQLESSTTADQDAGRLTYEWATATHATRKALSKWTVYDTAEREGLRIEADGSNPMIGFLGTTAVAQQSGTGETTGFTAGSGTGVNDDSTFTGNVGATAYRISDVVKALKNYGLLAQ